MKFFGSALQSGMLRMAYGADGSEVVDTKTLTLQEALKLAKEIPAEPTVATDLTVSTTANGRRILNIAVPLDMFDSECRKKVETLKGGRQKVKCGMSLVGMIPSDTFATITSPDGTIKAPVKTGQPLRVNIGFDLGSYVPVETPAYMKVAAKADKADKPAVAAATAAKQ